MAPGDRAHATLDLAKYPPRHIDQVLLQRDAFVPLQAAVILDEPDAEGTLASDHYGVLARFRVVADAPRRLLILANVLRFPLAGVGGVAPTTAALCRSGFSRSHENQAEAGVWRSPQATLTRSRPSALARYMAASARRTQSSASISRRSASASPMLSVQCWAAAASPRSSRKRVRMRSATVRAPRTSASASTTANSSPP